jgi:hypothetical protein
VVEGRTVGLINTEEVTFVGDCDILVTQSPLVLEQHYLPRRPKVVRYNIVGDDEEDHEQVASLLSKNGYKVNTTDQYVLALDNDLVKEFLELAF